MNCNKCTKLILIIEKTVTVFGFSVPKIALKMKSISF